MSSQKPSPRSPPTAAFATAVAGGTMDGSGIGSGVNGPMGGTSYGGSDGETSSVYSGVSVTSIYRHHSSGPFMSPSPAEQPQPVLSRDVHHKPKTTGSFGVLIVGLGGANGCTLLAGILAHRLQIEWHGPRGEHRQPNWYGCITQLPARREGYKDRIRGLADASMAAIGGWVSCCVFCC